MSTCGAASTQTSLPVEADLDIAPALR